MRGKAPTVLLNPLHIGITPAYAGKRSGTDLHRIENKDHPRLCGEKCTIYPPLMTKIGSPPPMRGKADAVKIMFATARITPAYAGKRLRKDRCLSVHQDHPRLCGEKFLKSIAIIHSPGSPPPMRGKVWDQF